MRLTQALRAQHLGHMFKKHWLVQGRRTPQDSGAKAALEARNIQVADAVDVVKTVIAPIPFKFERLAHQPLPLDPNHPDYNERHCYAVDDAHVVLEGLAQAQVLTRSVAVEGLPSEVAQLITSNAIPEESDRNARIATLTAHVFDAEQVKLAIRKDPKRPAFVLPRDYGISDERRMRLLLHKLLAECEHMAGRTITSTRQIVHNVPFSVPIERDGDLIRFGVHAESFITSKRPIAQPADADQHINAELPDLFPIKHTISLPKSHFYKQTNQYPISMRSPFNHAHTILLHYSPLKVHNLHGTPVTDTQLEARSLLKAFTVAAASARARFGADVAELPQPIVVQSVQTDGRRFQFGTFQLNTLRLSADDVTAPKNVWYSGPAVPLFEACEYRVGQPVLIEYNRQVLRHLYAFYRNN